jgi:hypothetical protein
MSELHAEHEDMSSVRTSTIGRAVFLFLSLRKLERAVAAIMDVAKQLANCVVALDRIKIRFGPLAGS